MIPQEHALDADSRPLNPPRPTLFTRALYLRLLTWAFTGFSSVRVLSYLPGMWAIWEQGDSSQHSLLTWCTWLGANLTMAAWLHEHNGQRFHSAVWVNLANATMCAATVVLIVAFRLAS